MLCFGCLCFGVDLVLLCVCAVAFPRILSLCNEPHLSLITVLSLQRAQPNHPLHAKTERAQVVVPLAISKGENRLLSLEVRKK